MDYITFVIYCNLKGEVSVFIPIITANSIYFVKLNFFERKSNCEGDFTVSIQYIFP